MPVEDFEDAAAGIYKKDPGVSEKQFVCKVPQVYTKDLDDFIAKNTILGPHVGAMMKILGRKINEMWDPVRGGGAISGHPNMKDLDRFTDATETVAIIMECLLYAFNWKFDENDNSENRSETASALSDFVEIHLNNCLIPCLKFVEETVGINGKNSEEQIRKAYYYACAFRGSLLWRDLLLDERFGTIPRIRRALQDMMGLSFWAAKQKKKSQRHMKAKCGCKNCGLLIKFSG